MTPLSQLARETAEKIASRSAHTNRQWDKLVEEMTPRILSALEKATAEANKFTQHAGDCTIYSSVINERAIDGICTCGYGWQRVTDCDWSEMISNERITHDADLRTQAEALVTALEGMLDICSDRLAAWTKARAALAAYRKEKQP